MMGSGNRYIEPVLANTITGDWSRFAEYTAWSSFPYEGQKFRLRELLPQEYL